MIIKILKRDGRIEFFEKDKITEAIFKAAQACGGKDKILSATLADLVVKAAEAKFNDKIRTAIIKQKHGFRFLGTSLPQL